MVQTGTLTSLFQELVHTAIQGQRIAASETTECYLVFLLERFTRPGRSDLLDPPLGVDYLRAFEQDAARRFETLRRVADTALFVTGVFADSLDRSLVGTPYYTALGRNAYAHLSAHIGRGDLATAFVDLADRFPEFVAVLSTISALDLFRSDSDALRLYRRWLRTGDHRQAALLVRRGLIPAPASKTRQ
jgi:hypothetical protein